MTVRPFWLPALLIGTQFLSGADITPPAQLVATYEMPRTSLNCLVPAGAKPFDLTAALRNGLGVTNSPSVGSGLARNLKGDLFGITDRGPNSLLKQSANGKEHRVLPLPEFAPGIARLRLDGKALELQEFIALRDQTGKPLTGRSNEKTDEPCYASIDDKEPLPADPGGVDPEGIRCLPDGNFLLSEEYSPSVFVVSPRGEVLVRYTPKSKPLPGAGYPVKPILPDALIHRRVNRGFECLALSGDGHTAYAILQSSIGEVDDARYTESRLHRVIELDVTNPLDAHVTGMFLLPATPAAQLRDTKKQNQVKLNDAEWLGPRRLLVLEQGKANAHLLIVDLNGATNLLNQPDSDSLAYEDVHTDLASRKVQPAVVTTLLDLASIPAINSTKLEGLVILAPNEIALANDNDFGIGENETGESSKIWVLRFSGQPFEERDIHSSFVTTPSQPGNGHTQDSHNSNTSL